MSGRFWSFAAAGYLVACLLLGGASAAGAAANALLQLVGLGLIVALLWRRDWTFPPEARGALWVGAGLILVGLLSLIPLPAGLASEVPLRGQIVEAFRLIGLAPPSLPVSLAPPSTIASLLHLLPAAAMFLLVLRLPNDERRTLPLALLAVAGVSIVLGAFQLMGGADSPARFYSVTNRMSPVGFFANVNHEATLLLCALPLTAVLAGRAATRRSRSKRSGGAIISLALAVFIVAGIAISGSSAGYGLALPVAVASFLIYRRSVAGRVAKGWAAALGLFLVLFAFAAVRGPLSTETFEGELATQPSSRRVLATTTLEAIRDSFPVGTGLGTMSTVYRRYEDPYRVTRQFANHTHNDYLEAVLELGAPGILLILGFLFWWARRSFQVWTRDFQGAALARAGSVMIGIVLLHSIVDYPIRTAAIVAVFALGCALMVPPAPQRGAPGRSDEESATEPLRHIEAA
ncbi:MAG TPA: O-antigen ligase family protein [Allosphingosinicella sp.]|nr:O-antigen ligase family protein [Allosphingosinicella sp.]